ncbi:MAG: hypothetical protein WC890_06480 [Candidatus Margulisiibacteriota bacterium]
MKKLFLVTLSLCLYVGIAYASLPLVTDDFYTVVPGGHELEIDYDSLQGQASHINDFDLFYKIGFTDKFDLGIEIPYTTSGNPGLNDIYLHAKYRLWQVSKDEGLTARIDYKFKNGNINQGLGSGDDDAWLMLIYSKMFGITKTHFNVAYVNVGVNAGLQYDDYFAYTAAAEYPAWGEKGDIVAECVANNTVYFPNPAFIQIGARYYLSKGLNVNGGYSFGLNTNTFINNLSAGIHWEF